MDGGAWPFLVGGVICLVNSDNERDSPLLTDFGPFRQCDSVQGPTGVSSGTGRCPLILGALWVCAYVRGLGRACSCVLAAKRFGVLFFLEGLTTLKS